MNGGQLPTNHLHDINYRVYSQPCTPINIMCSKYVCVRVCVVFITNLFTYSQSGFILFLLGVALTLLFILIQIFGIAYALSFFG